MFILEYELIDFESDFWERYRGAYGNIKEWVQILVQDTQRQQESYQEAFDNLSQSITHQMSFYPATYLVVPYLLELLNRMQQQHDFDWQCKIIEVVGTCLATQSQEYPVEVEKELIENYQRCVNIFKEKTKQLIACYQAQLKQLDWNTKNYFETAVLSILGDSQAAFAIILSGWTDCNIACEQCDFYDENLDLEIEEQRQKIIPADTLMDKWDNQSLQNTYLWFCNLLHLLGDEKSQEKLRYYYGTYTCPECGKQGLVIEMMKHYLSDEWQDAQ